MTETTDAKPAVKSLTLQSLVTLALSLALSKLGTVLPDGAISNIAGAAIDFLSMIGILGAAVGRARADKKIG
jgi:hypothetical protein